MANKLILVVWASYMLFGAYGYGIGGILYTITPSFKSWDSLLSSLVAIALLIGLPFYVFVRSRKAQ